MTESKELPRKRQSPWLLAFTLLLAAGFLYLAVRQVDWQETLSTLRSANLLLAGAALLVFWLACVARGLRWRVLLSAERPVSFLTVFWSMMAGYLGNSYLPARAGEVIRAVMVGRRGGISKSFALATALTERMADAIILVAISAVALANMPSLPPEITTAMRVMAVIAGISSVIIFLAPRMRGLVQTLIHKLPVSERWRNRIGDLAENFLLGAGALLLPERLGQFALYSFLIWGMDVTVGMLMGRALGLTLRPEQIFLLLAALGIASAIPSTPGYVGVYQFVAINVLVPFGVSPGRAMAYILAFQGMIYIGTTILGVIGLVGPGTPRVVPAAET